jgi:ferredoxin
MIVAERKPVKEIKELIAKHDKILTVGCATCVAVCLAGGEKEVGILNKELLMARKLAGKPVKIDGRTLERQCDMEFLAELDDVVAEYDALISLACGVGIQFLAERFPDTPVYPGVNTAFMGANRDVGHYEERCRGCGTCVLGLTGGVCPVTMCAKGLFNGPCGGTNLESCEINTDQPCAWRMIYERLKRQGRLDNILKIHPPNEWRNQTPRTIIQPGYKKHNRQ